MELLRIGEGTTEEVKVSGGSYDGSSFCSVNRGRLDEQRSFFPQALYPGSCSGSVVSTVNQAFRELTPWRLQIAFKGFLHAGTRRYLPGSVMPANGRDAGLTGEVPKRPHMCPISLTYVCPWSETSLHGRTEVTMTTKIT